MKTYVKLSGLGATEATTAIKKVNIQLQPRFPSKFQMNIEALVLPKLTKRLPNNDTNVTIPWNNCLLADSTFNKSGPIDMIIGADIYAMIVLNGIRKTENNILLQNTELGWIVSGKVPQAHNHLKVIAIIAQDSLDNQLRRFWELEEAPTDQTLLNNQDVCETHFHKTHRRHTDGTYTVQIPFKEPMQQLGDSRRQALARLLQNERKFLTNKHLETEYKKFMAEYIYLGHMKLIKNPEKSANEACYLPHQAVIKPDSTTTKLRVVFDASAKTSTGVSLNDNMLAGPRLQPELSDILLRWRTHQYVFTADVEKMYRQIKLASKDQNYHRILWRFNPNEPIREYKLTTVTYGTTSAPFLAIKTIQQLATDEQRKYPNASKAVFRDFYVDDVMSGAGTMESAMQLQQELIKLLKAGGFNLRKWTSNHTELLKNIPEEIREQGILSIDKDKTIKTLGIHWNPISDTFQFKVNIGKSGEQVTKRLMLSKIAQIFDPLGWITPVTLRAKVMIQELWKLGISWDEVPPVKLTSEWSTYQQQLPKLEVLRIQRWINRDQSSQIEFHGFCDASERAYAAVVYCKITQSSGTIKIHLITGKSKVAPVKSKLTIPRLELCGAELLSKLMTQTIKTLGIDQPVVYLWSDSMITITRLKGTTNKLPCFETSRIRQILSVTSPQQWNYVRTNENPADCASRGLNVDQIKEHKLWWNGPTWLTLQKELWPTVLCEIKETPKEHNIMTTTAAVLDTSLLDRFSSIKTCIRAIAYCHRFSDKCKQINKNIDENLTIQELIKAEKSIIKYTQASAFSEECSLLQKKKTLPTRSVLVPLSPFIDNEGIMRVGGRLENSSLSYDEQHPIILPQKLHLTQLIIQDAHLKTLHGGNQHTLAYIRRKYWILNGRNLVKKHIHNCITCFRMKAQTCQQKMGNLPSPRVTPSPPFTHTGVDYAGPIHLKASKVAKSKTYKGYIALFICLSTKAFHIEAVSDLTSEAFLAAFKRFTAKRGHCQHLYSDCGTTFIGAQKSLERDFHSAVQTSTREVSNLIINDGTQWHFNPPAAPHMGGIWEAGIKSIKYHLKRIIGNVTLTYEELTTTLHQIEASLNSRPLCPQNDDPTDYTALTPGHFLIGRPPISPPRMETDESVYSYRTRWKLVNKLSDDFWRIWSSEYLSRLQQKPKWWKEQNNLKIDELVLIKDETMPPTKWKLGRIIAVHPGKDGLTRVVTLRCPSNTVIKRPITKLCRLPTSPDIGEKCEENNKEKPKQVRHLSSQSRKRKHSVPLIIQDTVRERYFKELEEAKRNRPSKRVRIRPVTTEYDNLVPLEKQKKAREQFDAMRQNTKQPIPQTKSRSSMWNTTLTCLSLLSAATLTKATYNISYQKPGLYIEHIGEANLRRGVLRVELTLPLNTSADINRIDNILRQMKSVCTTAQQKSEKIQCDALLRHLEIQGTYLLQEIGVVNKDSHTRNKRGLLGKALQYVFGVNDEVYTDISALQQNQQILHHTSIQQSAIMLSTIAHINDTENRITEKLKSFTNKLNDAMKEINVVEGWFTKINTNMINLHVLTAYQIATNILDELERQYVRIVAVSLGKGSLLQFFPPSKLNKLVENVSKGLPNGLYVTNNPEDRINTKRNATNLTVFGYLNIIETNPYTIVKATPIPQKLQNNTYVIADIPNTILAINYNKQTYFELNEDDLKNCINEQKHQVSCLPTAISSIEANPNCILDEIYDRPEKTPCVTKVIEISTILWKQLYMTNTWLFITTKPVPASVKCNGIHEDITLNGTGIIQITTECVIKTKRNTLIPEIFDRTAVKSTFNRPVELNLTVGLNNEEPKIRVLQMEQILKSSDTLTTIRRNQEILHQTVSTTTLQTIGHHTLSTGIAIIISISIIIIITAIKKKSPRTWKPSFVLNIPPTPPTERTDSTVEAENV